MIDWCSAFLHEVGLQKAASEPRNLYAMVLLLSHFSAGNLDSHFAGSTKMKPYLQDLKRVFSHVFRENSVFLRFLFFNDPLIRELWQVYARSGACRLADYLGQLNDKSVHG